MRHELNLATRPFLNPRPVKRVTVALWVLGMLVAGLNVRLYLSHYSGSGADRAREQELQATLSRERVEVRDLREELADFDVAWQNQQANFLNAKIAERSFSWSVLFDRLGEAMPAEVRLNALSPSFGARRSDRRDVGEGEVLLGIRGQAKGSAVLLEFVDSLFAHRSFRAPNLASESQQDGGLTDFSLSVVYRRAAEESPVDEAVEAPVDGAASDESVEDGSVFDGAEADTAAEPETDDEGDTRPLPTEAVTP